MATVTLNRQKNITPRQPATTNPEQGFNMSNTTTRKSLTIYHQNIKSLISKKEELHIYMQDMSVSPHLICLSEHNLKAYEITKFTLHPYKIAASYCRERVPKRGVCMTRHNLQFATMDLSNFCRESIFEICAIVVNTENKKIIVGCLYRSPSGDSSIHGITGRHIKLLTHLLEHYNIMWGLEYKLLASIPSQDKARYFNEII